MRRDIKDLKRLNLPTGSHHHRAFVGPPEKYDIVSAMQFNLLTFLGLREDHYLLDIGCGSLRGRGDFLWSTSYQGIILGWNQKSG